VVSGVAASDVACGVLELQSTATSLPVDSLQVSVHEQEGTLGPVQSNATKKRLAGEGYYVCLPPLLQDVPHLHAFKRPSMQG
jgi:hypothetical protein